MYKRNYVMAFSICLTFAIQYTFYPGVIFKHQLGFFPDFGWFVIFIVTFHSFWDTVGRWLAGKINLIPKSKFLLASMSRFVFFVVYLLSNKSDNQIFRQDWFIITLFFLFSLSCGYLSTLGMNYGSDESTQN